MSTDIINAGGKTPEQLRAKAEKQNRHSIDGLEGLDLEALK